MASSRKIRFAVVGTGWFGQAAVLPAFKHVPNATLAAIVSGDPTKREELGRHYGVKSYSYEQYDALLGSGDIDAVYIVLPNSLHRDYTIRAANARIPVLCEKPLAGNAEDARRMIAACAQAGVPLMTAYRLHFESANLAVVELVEQGKIGEPRLFSSLNLQQVEDQNTRLDASLQGHPLLDIGIYCINAARYLFQDEPYEVSAIEVAGNDERFREMPEMVSCVMRFPRNRVATFTCGFGEAKVSEYRIVGTAGDIRMDPAYAHQGPLAMHVTIDGETESTKYPEKDQVGAEILYFADCLLNEKRPEPDGEEGLIDLLIIDGLRESLKSHQPFRLPELPEHRRPSRAQEIKVKKAKEPELINAASPSGQ